MSTVDEIIQNLIAKQEEIDQEQSSARVNVNEIKATIKNIADYDVYLAGKGAYKKVFPYKKDKVILEEGTYRQTMPFSVKKQIVNKLNEYGINTPKLVYYLTQDQAFKLGNKEISYEVQERAKGSFLNTFDYKKVLYHLYGLTGEMYPYLTKSSEKLLSEKYNFEMLKSRTLTGIPHIEKFLKHFTCLVSAYALDVNGGNFFYSPAFGYTFIDLNLDKFNDENISDLENFFNSKINNINKTRIMTDYSNFMHCCVDSLHEGGLFKPDPNEDFEAYVYTGILCKQFLNVMQTSTDPKLRFAKEFAQKFKFPNFYGANPQDLDLLYSAMKSNDEASLESIRQKFDLPANYNFSDNLEGKKFIQAMDLTYAMDQPLSPTLDENGTEL